MIAFSKRMQCRWGPDDVRLSSTSTVSARRRSTRAKPSSTGRSCTSSATRTPHRTGPDRRDRSGGGALRTPATLDSGIYTVVLASDAAVIPRALDQVPRSKRPAPNEKLFSWRSRQFPGWPVALCCFDNRDVRHATPMLWWYRPRFPEVRGGECMGRTRALLVVVTLVVEAQPRSAGL